MLTGDVIITICKDIAQHNNETRRESLGIETLLAIKKLYEKKGKI